MTEHISSKLDSQIWSQYRTFINTEMTRSQQLGSNTLHLSFSACITCKISWSSHHMLADNKFSSSFPHIQKYMAGQFSPYLSLQFQPLLASCIGSRTGWACLAGCYNLGPPWCQLFRYWATLFLWFHLINIFCLIVSSKSSRFLPFSGFIQLLNDSARLLVT